MWTQERLVRGAILLFWTCFWLFNVVDKAIGGSTFLWVGRDRFAQFQKYFASAGLESPWIADVALYVAAALEVFALVFFAGALLNFAARRAHQARSWCFIGIVITLVTFTFFSIGDHLFGDRFELLAPSVGLRKICAPPYTKTAAPSRKKRSRISPTWTRQRAQRTTVPPPSSTPTVTCTMALPRRRH